MGDLLNPVVFLNWERNCYINNNNKEKDGLYIQYGLVMCPGMIQSAPSQRREKGPFQQQGGTFLSTL